MKVHMKPTVFEKKPFIEMMIIVVLMLISAFFFPQLKGLFAIIPIIYFLIERKIRKRTRENIGLNLTNLGSDFRKVWLLILVSIVLQVFYFIIYKNVFPEVFAHVLERTSLIESFNGKLILSLLILALGEEIAFRGLVQKRLGWVMKPIYAIFLTSVLFALMHISSGDSLVVIIDLTTVFIDSVLFGVIFYKTNNIYMSWVAHAIGNIISALLITTI